MHQPPVFRPRPTSSSCAARWRWRCRSCRPLCTRWSYSGRRPCTPGSTVTMGSQSRFRVPSSRKSLSSRSNFGSVHRGNSCPRRPCRTPHSPLHILRLLDAIRLPLRHHLLRWLVEARRHDAPSSPPRRPLSFCPPRKRGVALCDDSGTCTWRRRPAICHLVLCRPVGARFSSLSTTLWPSPPHRAAGVPIMSTAFTSAPLRAACRRSRCSHPSPQMQRVPSLSAASHRRPFTRASISRCSPTAAPAGRPKPVTAFASRPSEQRVDLWPRPRRPVQRLTHHCPPPHPRPFVAGPRPPRGRF